MVFDYDMADSSPAWPGLVCRHSYCMNVTVPRTVKSLLLGGSHFQGFHGWLGPQKNANEYLMHLPKVSHLTHKKIHVLIRVFTYLNWQTTSVYFRVDWNYYKSLLSYNILLFLWSTNLHPHEKVSEATHEI